MAEGSIKAAHKFTNTAAKLYLHKLYTWLRKAVIDCVKKKKKKFPNCHLRGCISFECFQFHKQEKECSAIPDNWLFSSSASYSSEKLRREIIFEESGPLRSCIEGMKLIWKLLLSNH